MASIIYRVNIHLYIIVTSGISDDFYTRFSSNASLKISCLCNRIADFIRNDRDLYQNCCAEPNS